MGMSDHVKGKKKKKRNDTKQKGGGDKFHRSTRKLSREIQGFNNS